MTNTPKRVGIKYNPVPTLGLEYDNAKVVAFQVDGITDTKIEIDGLILALQNQHQELRSIHTDQLHRFLTKLRENTFVEQPEQETALEAPGPETAPPAAPIEITSIDAVEATHSANGNGQSSPEKPANLDQSEEAISEAEEIDSEEEMEYFSDNASDDSF